jgi:hypothetical protein
MKFKTGRVTIFASFRGLRYLRTLYGIRIPNNAKSSFAGCGVVLCGYPTHSQQCTVIRETRACQTYECAVIVLLVKTKWLARGQQR